MEQWKGENKERDVRYGERCDVGVEGAGYGGRGHAVCSVAI